MIVGVPDHKELNETAIGWLNLAWEITIGALKDFYEFEQYIEFHQVDATGQTAEHADSYWHVQRYKLNNATTLLQQSLELFLKARIAEISPFLLILGDPQSWPRPNSSGEIEFSSFRTLDATHLIKVANVVSVCPLSKQFKEFYDRLRRIRKQNYSSKCR